MFYDIGVFDKYFFTKNLQGDIIEICKEDGTKVASYSYDAWGNHTVTNHTSDNIGNINPFRYRGYYFDSETNFYYLNSRYYDPEIKRFISADSIDIIGATPGGLTDKNLYAYCDNNPVMRIDTNGEFWLELGVIVVCSIFSGIMGAMSAASTGGNVLEGAIEGALTGAIGTAAGLLIANPLIAFGVAAIGASTVDLSIQMIANKSFNFSKVDPVRLIKTGIQTGVSTLIPKFGKGTENAIDAFGTALIWIEGGTLLSIADIVVTNIFDVVNVPKKPNKEHSHTTVN